MRSCPCAAAAVMGGGATVIQTDHSMASYTSHVLRDWGHDANITGPMQACRRPQTALTRYPLVLPLVLPVQVPLQT